MTIRTKLRRWGNSVGIVVPAELLRKRNLHEGEEIIVEIEKEQNISNAFGSLRDWKIDTQKMKDKIRKEENNE